MPLRKLKQIWPEAKVLKSGKKDTRFVLLNDHNIMKVYTHQAWKPLRNPGKVEFNNTSAFIQAQIACHKPLDYKKVFDFNTFRWVEVTRYRFLADYALSSQALKMGNTDDILRCIIRLLCDIAQKGFFHTDTNPANVLISPKPEQAHIIDIEEIIQSPVSINQAAALMISRFYNDGINQLVSFDQIKDAVKAVYREFKWDSHTVTALTTITLFSNKILTKAEKQHHTSLLQGTKR
jgi:serine/threonine protein kinase